MGKKLRTLKRLARIGRGRAAKPAAPAPAPAAKPAPAPVAEEAPKKAPRKRAARVAEPEE